MCLLSRPLPIRRVRELDDKARFLVVYVPRSIVTGLTLCVRQSPLNGAFNYKCPIGTIAIAQSNIQPLRRWLRIDGILDNIISQFLFVDLFCYLFDSQKDQCLDLFDLVIDLVEIFEFQHGDIMTFGNKSRRRILKLVE